MKSKRRPHAVRRDTRVFEMIEYMKQMGPEGITISDLMRKFHVSRGHATDAMVTATFIITDLYEDDDYKLKLGRHLK